MSGGQPRVKRQHTGLHAKAQQKHEASQKQNAFMPRGQGQVQRTARNKLQGIAVFVEKEYSKQSHVGAAHGIKQVFQRRHDRLLGTIVQNQRHGSQGHQLIEQIHGHQVSGKIQAHQNPVHDQIISKKPPLFPLVFHIGKSINAGKHPNNAHKGGKQASQGIYMKINRNILHEIEQGHASLSAPACSQRQDC